MRALLVLTAAVLAAGCDRAFGLHGVGERPVDAPPAIPDAPHVVGEATSLTGLTIITSPPQAPVAVGDPAWPVMATVAGTAGQFVPLTLGASAGALTSSTGEIQIGPTGTATLVVQYQPPATGIATTAMLAVRSGTRSATLDVPIRGLVRIGDTVTDLSGATTKGADTVFGMRLAVPSGYLKKVGFAAKAAANAWLGVYEDTNGSPGALVAAVGPVALVVGMNEVHLLDLVGGPTVTGVVWAVALFDQATVISAQSGASGVANISAPNHPFANGLPPTLIGTIDSTNTHLCNFVGVAP